MRTRYICGSYKPLLRGIIHILLCLWLMQYYAVSFFLSIEAYVANILIIFGCIASVVYHDVHWPKYEALFQKIDHFFVLLHVVAIYMLTIKHNFVTHIILYVMIIMVTIASYGLFRTNNYLFSRQYYLNFLIMTILTIFSRICFGGVLGNVFCYSLCLYIVAILNYMYTRAYTDGSKIWSAHETYHLLQSIADMILVSNNLI